MMLEEYQMENIDRIASVINKVRTLEGKVRSSARGIALFQIKLLKDGKEMRRITSDRSAAEWRKLIRRRREEFLDADRRLLDSLKRRTIRHLAHAIQLNPNLVLHDSDHEEALYELCMAINDRNPTVRHLYGDRAFFCERFAETFPDSRHHREMVLCAAGAYWKLQLACRDALRRGDTGLADYRTLRLRYLEKTITGCGSTCDAG